MNAAPMKIALMLTLALGCLTLGPTACNSSGGGPRFNTKPGEQVTEAMLLGKWDLDGERTNTANGHGGVGAIPSDVTKDVLGKGWKFDPDGVLKTDRAVGWKTGSWRLEGKSTLVVNEGSGEQKYDAHFQDGYLYLKKADGKFLVFERDTDFGT